MRAAVITQPGDVDVLELRDVARPEPGAGEILVRVAATAVNRADLMQRRGYYPAPPGWPQDIPGLEYAGVVEACGTGAAHRRAGDRVMGIVGGGSYAEYVVVHEDEAIPVPDALSLEEAAAIPEAFLTAHDALRMRLGVPNDPGRNRGKSLLIHAVASGVGTAALQLAHSMGLRVFGTTRSAWKIEKIAQLAPATLIDSATTDFVEVIRANTANGVDYIMDLVGGDYMAANVKAAAPLARIVVVGLVAGSRASLDMRTLLNKRLTLVGTVLRARSRAEKIEAARLFTEEVLPWLADRRIVPVLDRVMPMEDVRDAHRLAEANRNVGKIVLRW